MLSCILVAAVVQVEGTGEAVNGGVVGGTLLLSAIVVITVIAFVAFLCADNPNDDPYHSRYDVDADADDDVCATGLISCSETVSHDGCYECCSNYICIL